MKGVELYNRAAELVEGSAEVWTQPLFSPLSPSQPRTPLSLVAGGREGSQGREVRPRPLFTHGSDPPASPLPRGRVSVRRDTEARKLRGDWFALRMPTEDEGGELWLGAGEVVSCPESAVSAL